MGQGKKMNTAFNIITTITMAGLAVGLWIFLGIAILFLWSMYKDIKIK